MGDMDMRGWKRCAALGLALFLTLAVCRAVGIKGGTQQAEKTGDVYILFTSDVHCGIDMGFGYAGLQMVRDDLIAAGNEVILVDNGDSVQGEAIGLLTKGEAVIGLMNRIGYSVAIPGNHEFEYGMEQFFALTEMAEFPYISCNFRFRDELVFDPYVIRELGGHRIAFVGVTTPQTLITSTPSHFQDGTGAFVYSFGWDETGETVYEDVQKAVDAARAEGAEYVVVLAHLGSEATCRPWTYADVISHTTGIDVLLDGHSHDTDRVVMKNREGRAVERAACGTKLSCIGWCRISADGRIRTGLYTWDSEVPASELLGLDNDMARAVAQAAEETEALLNRKVGVSHAELTVSDPTVKDANGIPIRMVRRAETNLGDFCADALRFLPGTDAAVINGGAIRTGLERGDVTCRDLIGVFPFENHIVVIRATGQQILDALEWGARGIPDECGAFLQVSWLRYEIDDSVPSGCRTGENGMMIGIEGMRRVRNVFVGDAPIDPDKTYTLAGTDYILLLNGDGFTAFDGAELLKPDLGADRDVLLGYIESLGGVIGEEYADPYGQGRIGIIGAGE